MRGELVALDLETTGLDIEKDAIIEIGAVRFKDGRIIEEFSALINPGFDIPTDVSHLTGIHPEDVVSAPILDVVLPQINTFVGSAPLIAHNVEFDHSFLKRFGLFDKNIGIDTYDLAAILLPRTARYTLSNLTKQVGIELEHAHRALDDARATALLYWHLWQKALQLPYPILREISQSAETIQDWDTARFFVAAAQERSQHQDDAALVKTFTPLESDPRPLRPNDTLETLDISAITQLIDQDGTLQSQLNGYEHRPQQVTMAQHITQAFNESSHFIIEAGTGTGKSIAYLAPAILWAVQNNERVVIATNTINLQDQLIKKDIPLLAEAIGEPFKAAVMKGRGNYLCPRRLSLMRRRPLNNVDELRALAKVLVWMQESQTGDKSDLTLRGPSEHMIWARLSAEDEGCTTDRCKSQMNGICPFYKARRQAEAAHVLIVNHALLISDAASDNHVLPPYRYLIVDEAHQLEDAITYGMSYRIDRAMLLRRLDDLGGPNRGLLGDLLKIARSNLPDKKVVRLEAYMQHIAEASSAMRAYIDRFFRAVRNLLVEQGLLPSDNYRTQLRVVTDHRGRAAFAQIQTTWSGLAQFFEAISEAMQHLTGGLQRLNKEDIPGLSDLTNSTASVAAFLAEVRLRLEQFANDPDANTVYWINAQGTDDPKIIIHTAPLHVGPLMDTYLWQKKESIVLTSATMQTEGNFNYMRERLYAEDIKAIDVGSPFDYRASTLVYIPDDIPEPGAHRSYQRAVERGIIELSAALGGHVMVLFTSYVQLRETAQNITPRLALGNISVFDQSAGSSRETLLEEFKSTSKAVLLGTKSFWQGVDIPGDDLQALVIARLPFAVPNDPIFAARSETYNNAFKEFAVPDAILRFRQGFGRLIRTRSDRGIVAIFDARISTKGYGHSFLDSLPDCTVQQSSLDILPATAAAWLNQTTSTNET